jgi:hypothetical protein
MSYIQGGKFWSSFAAGCISSIASSAWQGGDSTGGVHHRGISGATVLNNGAGTIFFGTISGGAGAALTGGNFWQGAVTGLIVSGLNHVAHMGEQRRSLLSRFKKDSNGKYIVDPFGKPDFSDAGVAKINGAVEGLGEDYALSGKPKVYFDETVDVAYTDPGEVHLNVNKIRNNLHYAATLFHEYRHAWQFLPGLNGLSRYNNWTKKYGGFGANNLKERDAYWYQIQMGAGDYNEGYYRYNSFQKLTNYIKIPY